MSATHVASWESESATPEKRVTFVELFFDLVFVFSLTQVTGVVEHHVTLVGFLQAVLVFWLLWWAWTQFTWALNAADTDSTRVRVTALIGTLLAFLMGTGVDEAFEDSAMWFAAPYVLVRLTGLSFLIVRAAKGEQRGPALTFAGISVAGLSLVLVGAALPLPWRYGFWLAAIVVDLIAANASTRQQSWRLNPGHFAERHALFVIIALGESVVAAGLTTAAEPRTVSLVLVGVGAALVTCLLWWSYFGWFQKAALQVLERTADPEQSRMASTAYSLLHFPLVGGVIGIAVAFEEMLHNPTEHLDFAGIVALALGVTLFVGATALSWLRVSGRWLWPRLLLLGVMWASLIVAAPHAPAWAIWCVAVTLLVIIVLEYWMRAGSLPTAAQRPSHQR